MLNIYCHITLIIKNIIFKTNQVSCETTSMFVEAGQMMSKFDTHACIHGIGSQKGLWLVCVLPHHYRTNASTVYPKKYAHGFVVLCFVVVIGIDHDTVCAGVVGTAIRNSTSCAGRRAAACGRAGRHNEYQPRQHRPYKWSISILPRSQFTKSKGNLRFRRLVPLFVPIGVCVTTHDDGTASDVTIGMWRHNQQVTNHERNGKPWFSLPK